MLEHPNVQRTLGEMHTNLEPARQFLHEAARVRTIGGRRAMALGLEAATLEFS